MCAVLRLELGNNDLIGLNLRDDLLSFLGSVDEERESVLEEGLAVKLAGS